jgi:hypothetical protein
LLEALEGRCVQKAVKTAAGEEEEAGGRWGAAARQWFAEGAGQEAGGGEEIGEWLLTLQGAFLGWADALASIILLDELEVPAEGGAGGGAGGLCGEHLAGQECARRGYAEEIVGRDGMGLVVRAMEVCKALEKGTCVELPDLPGEGAVWWVKGHTVFQDGAEQGMEIGHCSGTARETLALVMKLLAPAAR